MIPPLHTKIEYELNYEHLEYKHNNQYDTIALSLFTLYEYTYHRNLFGSLNLLASVYNSLR